MMRPRLIVHLTATCLGLMVYAALAGGPAVQPGLSGQIVVMPACPGPQKIDQRPCQQGLATARVQLLSSAGALVSSTLSDEQGRFKIEASPGTYTLHVDVEGLYPRCDDTRLTISGSRQTRVLIRCDSGMR